MYIHHATCSNFRRQEIGRQNLQTIIWSNFKTICIA